jgi:hypothetical protein
MGRVTLVIATKEIQSILPQARRYLSDSLGIFSPAQSGP